MFISNANAPGVTNHSQQSIQGFGNNESLQESFLTMLTAQLRNQDPTNPLDSGQMVTQLSQISSAQGLLDLKELMQTQIITLLGGQRLASSSLIGKNIDYKTDDLTVDKENSNFSGYVRTDDDNLKNVTIEIKDSNGKVVKSITAPKNADGQFEWHWDGKLADGSKAAFGQYQINAKTKVGDNIISSDVILNDEVNQVQFQSDGSTILKLAHGAKINMGDVVSIGV